MLVHLGMTGHWVRRGRDEPAPRFGRGALRLDDGASLWFTDARRFGCWTPARDLGPSLGEGLGPDALATPLDAAALTSALREVRMHEEAIAAQVHAGLIRLAAQLDADERRTLARHLSDRRSHGRDRRPPKGSEKLPSTD